MISARCLADCAPVSIGVRFRTGADTSIISPGPNEPDTVSDAVPAMRRGDGDARPGAGRAVETRSILGLPPLRPAFLDDIPGPSGSIGASGGRFPGVGLMFSGARPGAANLPIFLTSLVEVPTLAAFSSSACVRSPNRVARESGRSQRKVVGVPGIRRAASSRPTPCSQLVELPGCSRGCRSSEDVCQPGPSHAC